MTIEQLELIELLEKVVVSEEFTSLYNTAAQQNEWFTPASITQAVAGIRAEMLAKNRVEQWLTKYRDSRCRTPQKVGIVMAGNIPLVGFLDLFCVLITGSQAIVKPSSKDAILISHIAYQLSRSGYVVEITDKIDPGQVDKIIATGGEVSSSYFATKFVDKPSLIRSDRYSVAILTGNETPQQIEGLRHDMFDYWGLGCRSVSHLLVPRGYNLAKLPDFETDFKPWNSNLRYNRALNQMKNVTMVEKRGYLIINTTDRQPIGVISYSEYDKVSEIELPEKLLQCVITDAKIDFKRVVEFGESQRPTLYQYPDSKDIINFLLKS